MARGYFPCVSSVSKDIEKKVEREREALLRGLKGNRTQRGKKSK